MNTNLKGYALPLQGAVSMDRFYNLMPFISKMPHNQFYANLSSKVAGKCIDARFANGSASGKQAMGPASTQRATLASTSPAATSATAEPYVLSIMWSGCLLHAKPRTESQTQP